MICPKCGTENKPGAAFCGSCGARLAEAGAATQPVPAAPAPAAPTQPMPAAAAPAYAPPPQQPVYAPPPPGAYPPGAGPVPPGGAVPPGVVGPPPKKSSGAVVGIVIGIIVVLLLCCLGGFFGWRFYASRGTQNTTGSQTATTTTGSTTQPPAASFPTADAAVQDALAKKNASDWVYKVVQQSQGSFLYWIGPPNSEFTDQVIVTQNPDGTWVVQSVEALDGSGDSGGDSTGGGQSDVDQNTADAVATVEKFLYYVKRDQGMKAHALTIEPFASDGASAQMGAGDLLSWEVQSTAPGETGKIEVRVLEHWKSSGDMDSTYTLTPTRDGWRISELTVK